MLFAAMFLMVACDGSNLKLDDLISDANDTEAVDTDATDQADTEASDQTDTANNADTVADTDANDTDANDTDSNDTDANDTDANDTDSNDTDSNDTDSNDTDANDTDANDTDSNDNTPCDPNPCDGVNNSNGICTEEGDTYSCGCAEGYVWYESKCAPTATPSKCAKIAERFPFLGEVCKCFTEYDFCIIGIEIEIDIEF